MLGAHGVCVSRWPKLGSLERIGWVDLCLLTMWRCSLRTAGTGQPLGCSHCPAEQITCCPEEAQGETAGVFRGTMVLRGGDSWCPPPGPLPGCHVCFS